MDYQQVQNIAKDTMAFVRKHIKAGMTLHEVRTMCEEKMLELGADSFWYYDIGAFVFSGDETAVSVSGRVYKTSDRVICPNDIVTIDLSPQCCGTWGDYARTIILANGNVVEGDDIVNEEWRKGVYMENFLHEELKHFVTQSTTFEELFFHMNNVINEKGFVNLDFAGNLGHSIVREKDDRIYIEKGNQAYLDSVPFFTFEPHISIDGSNYGYKFENIYYFENGKLVEL